VKTSTLAFLKGLSTLQLALGISIALHAAVLTVRFVNPEGFNRAFQDTPLEVILVNAKSSERPDVAKAIAQASLAGGGEAELIAVTVARPQVESGLAQPVNSQVFQNVTERKNPQRLSGKSTIGIARRLKVFVLQPAGTDVAQSAAAQIVALGSLGVIRDQRRIDACIDGVREAL